MLSLTKKLIPILLALLLVSGCGGEAAPSSSPAPPPAQSRPESSPAPEEETLPAEAAEEADRLALLYETYCGGRAMSGGVFADGRGIYPTEDLAFGWLLEAGLLESRWNEETRCWDIPCSLLDEVNRFFFETMEPFPDGLSEEMVHYAGGPRRLPYTLGEGRDLRLAREKDGSVSRTYHRRMEGEVLTPVTYRFVPARAETVPEVLRGAYQPGDTVYRIAEVTQRPDLLPGHANDIIEIAAPEELLAAAERINRGDYADRHAIYRLTADIDLAGVDWTPMGRNLPVLGEGDERDPNPAGFSGVFDGQGHVIRNLTVTEERGRELTGRQPGGSAEQGCGGAGLFFAVGAEGVVKDLVLEDADIRLPMERPGAGGCTAGLAAAFCRGELQNVAVRGKIRAPYEVGGLVGTLTGPYETAGSAAAGAVTGCTADVEVTGYDTAGGLVGTLHYGTLRNSAAYGTVTAAGITSPYPEEMPRNIGGVVGLSVEGKVDNCHGGAAVRTLVPARCVGSFCGLAEGGGIHASTVDRGRAGSWEPVGDYYRLEPEAPEVWFN